MKMWLQIRLKILKRFIKSVYDDVVPAFERWLGKGIKLYIYSSGSIEAQKLLFGYSEKGDLTGYFSGYFDTTIGLKVEALSYRNILNEIRKSPNQVLFLTDLIKGNNLNLRF